MGRPEKVLGVHGSFARWLVPKFGNRISPAQSKSPCCLVFPQREWKKNPASLQRKFQNSTRKSDPQLALKTCNSRPHAAVSHGFQKSLAEGRDGCIMLLAGGDRMRKT